METQTAISPGQRILELQTLWHPVKLQGTRLEDRNQKGAATQYLKCISEEVAVETGQMPRNTWRIGRSGSHLIWLQERHKCFYTASILNPPLCLELATAVFLEASIASKALQQEGLDLTAVHSVVDGVLRRAEELKTNDRFTEISHNATITAGAVITRRAAEDHQVHTLEESYRGRQCTFLDTLRLELDRRFQSEGHTSDFIIIPPDNIMPLHKERTSARISTLCIHSVRSEFYGFQGAFTMWVPSSMVSTERRPKLQKEAESSMNHTNVPRGTVSILDVFK